MDRLSSSFFILVVLTVSANSDERYTLSGYRELMTSFISANDFCSLKYADAAAQAIQHLYSTIANQDCDLADDSSYPADYKPVNEEEFDFIVVGGGSAGSVVVNRLTEVNNWKVLLIEAGDNPTKSVDIPGFGGTLLGSDVDWLYKTDPNEGLCLGMEGNQCLWYSGKVLGGSSSINSMVYNRGNARVYDQWEADGNIGWKYIDVLPYFKKSEDMRAEEVLKTSDFNIYHSTGGNLKVESWYTEEVTPVINIFAQGMKELGYYTNPDANGRFQTGFTRIQGTLQDGRRCTTAKAFLTPATQRKNLKVSKNSLVTKILIDPKNITAYGVEFTNKQGEVTRVRAKKEVIVSCGTVASPKLLMLSGIGPKKPLESLKIPVIKDLPVGYNLQDHPMINSLVITLNPNYSKPLESPDETLFKFLLNKKSRYTSFSLAHVLYVNTVNEFDYPNMQIFPFEFDKNSSNLAALLNNVGYTDEIIQKYVEINKNSYCLLMLCSFVRPQSKGTIQLKSSDPKEYPKITTGYFSDPRDLDASLGVYDFLFKLVNTPQFRSVGAALHEVEVPGCSQFKSASRQYRECSLRHLTISTSHPTSTCRMGPTGSINSVVNPSLQVHGINRLRVIDASVMSSIVNANTNAGAIMIGEKGSDLLKNTWFNQRSE